MKIPAHIQKAIQAYYAERSTPEDVAALEDWFREDDAHIKIFAEYGMVEWQMLCEHEKIDAAAILHTLHEAEVEPALSLLDLPQSFPPAAEGDPSAPGSLSAQDYIKAGRYALHLVFTSKPAKKFYGRVAVAATLLLAVTLLVVFTRDEPSDLNDTVADLDFWDDIDTSTPPAVAPEITPVATLTAEHDAQWDSQPAEDLRRGSKLHPGTRLTLTAGFAEITTNDGAIAILEAPATIELTDNDNALHLHAGKLVGICETESSKGFVVRTPHLDITDLGTRFGVDASQPDATQVHVIEGMVEVASPAIDSSGPIRLSARQAIRADAVKVEQVAYMPTGFETDAALAQLRPRFEGLAAQWLGRPPADLTLGQQTSLALQVFTEQRGLVLDRETAVDFNAEHAWPDSGIGKHTVAAGTRVDVYLLHLDTPGESGASFIQKGKYTVHFDRPILGVIGAASSLRATDAILGTKGVSYPVIDPDAEDPKRETASGIDYPGAWSYIDYAEIIDNGTSLHLTLTTGAMMDQVRVLVAADPAGEHP